MHLPFPFPFHGRAGRPHVPPGTDTDTTAQMGRHHVLLVGPETLVPLLRSALATEGPHIDATDTAWLGRALAARYAYDLIVVDRPSDAQGRALCGRIRAAGIATPILLLGTEATGDGVLSGLAAGADEVLRKPVALATLRTQLLALLHQRCRATVVVTDPWEGASESDDLLVLTSEEYALLQYMVRQGGTTLQPDEIAAAVWGENVMLLPDAVESLAAMLYVKVAACDASRPSPWRVGAPTPCSGTRASGDERRQEMATDASDAIIVHSVVDPGHQLGLQGVVEGVENRETLDAGRPGV